MENRREKRCET